MSAPSDPALTGPRAPPLSILLVGFLAVCTACVATERGEDPGRPFLERSTEAGPVLRVMSWNVRLNSIFPPDGKRHEVFARIVRAVDPDVICLAEVWDTPDREPRLAALMDTWLPLESGRGWQVHGGADNVILSRHPLRCRDRELVISYPLPELGRPDFHYGQAMGLVDADDAGGQPAVYLVTLHNKSGAGERPMQLRQRQSDAVVRWLRDLRAGEGSACLSEGTPILVLGDLNVLEREPGDPLQHYTTLLTGDIADEARFGPDHLLDWDGSGLADVRPSHNARGQLASTWRDDSTPFPPGALDRILYTDSVLVLDHAFVLDTTAMGVAELERAGLLAADVLWEGRAGCYDHLPLIADFRLRPLSARQAGLPVLPRAR